MKEFKIRCSAISQIMTGTVGLTDVQEAKLSELQTRKNTAGTNGVKPLTANMEAELVDLIYKKANPQLPVGAKSYLKKWVKMKMFNREEDWKSIVVDKGLLCEQHGIDLLSEILSLEGVYKNDEFFENDFMQGSPDIIHNGIIRDIKNSWDLFTFPMFEDELPNSDYWWQLQGYMCLTKLKKASLDYTLIDTPMSLVMLDLKKLYYQSGGLASEWTQEKYEHLYPNYRFDDIPKEMRLKSFEFQYDESIENKIKERVLLCRKYINETLLKTTQPCLA
jgi:hypothetical protein